MRRPSLIIGAAVVTAVAVALVGPPAAQAANTAQLLVVNATPATNTPQVLDGEVDAVAAVGPDIVIGGTFTSVQDFSGGGPYPYSHIAAFNASTGLVDQSFIDPGLDGAVTALDVHGSNVVVGGSFTTVDGVAERGLAELDLTGARVAGFIGTLGGSSSLVDTLVVRGSHLFVGGRFSSVDAASRSALAVLDATTGALDTSFNVPVTGSVSTTNLIPVVQTLDVSADGNTLVIGGNFTGVGTPTQLRTQLAVIDAATGTVTGWETDQLKNLGGGTCSDLAVISQVNQLNISPDGTYFAMATTGGTGQGTLCDSASRWELGSKVTGLFPTWVDSTGGDSLTSVAATGTAVYVAGHQRWMNNFLGANSAGPGALNRKTVAALDPQTGMPLSWNPGITRGANVVGALFTTAAGLYVGSDSTVDFGTGHARLAFFPILGGTSVPAVQNTALPKDVYLAGSDGSLGRRAFNGLGFNAATPVPSPGTVPWASITGAFMLNGLVYYGTSDGVLHQAAFDGTTVSAPTTVSTWFDFSAAPAVTSFTVGNGRMYYVTGDGKLYYRWFSQESDVISSQVVTAAASGYTHAGEMFVAGGSLYFAQTTDHRLYRVALSAAGIPTGSAVAVSGPGIDPVVWDGPAAFLSSLPFTAPPTVSGVSPNSGLVAGGTHVTITGSGFVGGDTVAFGALPASAVTVVSATQITADAPAAPLGVVDVTVTSGAGGSIITSADHFTYVTGHVTDLVSRDTTGKLWLYPGNGTGGFNPRVQIGSVWNTMTAIVGVGDFNGDGHVDLVSRDTAGKLWLYPGNGTGGFKPRVLIGSGGWNAMTAIVGPGDFNGDTHPDLVARDTAGNLWLYPGNGTGGFNPRVQIGSVWNTMTAIVGPGDFNGDTHPDLVARDTTGKLWLYPGNGTGGFTARVQVGSGWSAMTAIIGIGDLDT